MKIDESNFDLEKQYEIYLKNAGLKKFKMSQIQATETKKAFMAGCAQLIFMFRDQLTELKEDEAVYYMERMKNQALQFWNNQITNKN